MFNSCHRQLNPLVNSGSTVLGNIPSWAKGRNRIRTERITLYWESTHLSSYIYCCCCFKESIKDNAGNTYKTKLQSFYLQSLLNIKFTPNGSLQNTSLHLVHKWKPSHIESLYGRYNSRKSLEIEKECRTFSLLNFKSVNSYLSWHVSISLVINNHTKS